MQSRGSMGLTAVHKEAMGAYFYMNAFENLALLCPQGVALSQC